MLELPDCCSSPSTQWPWPRALPGVQWIMLSFDKQRLAEGDFSHCGIEAPENIRDAAAKRQVEFLAGRLCAREALRALTGMPDVPLIAESRAPVWPNGLVGSITHSGTLAAALVASTEHFRGIGLDAEALLSSSRSERLAAQLLTPRELDWLASLPAEQQALFVTLIFSCKESLFKALFPLVGVRFYFQDAELIAWDNQTQQVTLRLLKPLADDWPAGSRLEGQYALQEDYLISMIAIPA